MHQWWARGFAPAAGRDGWFDEGWALYLLGDSNAGLSFEDDAPNRLRGDSPYASETPYASYQIGAPLFVTLADVVGEAELRAAMNELRLADPLGRIDTVDLERYLYCTLDEASIVREVFNRWVYGRSEDPEAVDPSWCRP